MRTDEPSNEEVDARGIIEERRRLGEVNEENLPVKGVEKPTQQTVPEAAAPVISSSEVFSESGLVRTMAEECLTKDRKRVLIHSDAKSKGSKASGSGRGYSSSGSRRPRSRSRAPK